MKIPTQLVNLLGAVLTAVIAVAGVAFIALPLWSQAQATDTDTRTVAQTNEVYAAQVMELQSASERMPEITADVAALRRGIPAAPQLDDVHEIVAAAAAASGSTVVSVVASDLQPWTARTQLGEILGEEEASAAAPAGTEDAEPAADGAEAAAPAGGDGTTGAEGAAADASSPQQQVTVTIEVEVPDATQAAAFIDALGSGPRLLGIARSELTSDKEGPLTLAVTAYAFLRTEN